MQKRRQKIRRDYTQISATVFFSDDERYSAVLKVWEKATNDVTNALQDGLDQL